MEVCGSLFSTVLLTAGWLALSSFMDYLVAQYRHLNAGQRHYRPLALQRLLGMPWDYMPWILSGIVVFGVAFVLGLIITAGGLFLAGLIVFALLGVVAFSDWQQMRHMPDLPLPESWQPVVVPEPQKLLEAPRPRALLRGIRGEYAGREFPLSRDLQIGRAAGNTIQLSQSDVSRLHAEIRYGAGKFFLQDKSAYGETYLNRRRIKAEALRDGDEIQIGDSVFVVRIVGGW